MMAGMGRKSTDNNGVTLWPSVERRKDGIREDAICFLFLLFLSMPPVLDWLK